MVIILIVKIKLLNYLRNSPPFTKPDGKSHLDLKKPITGTYHKPDESGHTHGCWWADGRTGRTTDPHPGFSIIKN
jgi:hypothetical protein